MRLLPRRWPIMIVPMFDELAITSVTVHCFTGCGSWSLKRWSATCMWSGTDSTVDGDTRPSSRAAEMVITLFTDPGS